MMFRAAGHLLTFALGLLVACGSAGLPAVAGTAEITPPSNSLVSAPLSSFTKAQKSTGAPTLRPAPRMVVKGSKPSGPKPADPALQRNPFSATPIQPKTGFNGIGFSGSLPPDPDIAVGPNHVVQVVNSQIAIYSKAGALLTGPVSLSSLWSALGGGCATNNGGDPSIQYDRQADRWLITQLGSLSSPYSECVAVSTSADPAGSYTLYSYSFGSDLNDYPKFSVWPSASSDFTGSAYLATYNMFSGNTFKGANLCAYDRKAMIGGNLSARQVCVLDTTQASYLPSDLEGTNPPPTDGNGNTPAYFLTDDNSTSPNTIVLQKAIFTFGTTPNLTLTSLSLAVISYSLPCGLTDCVRVPQSGTSRLLDTLGDRPMYRLAFRNFGPTQSMVFNHSVVSGSSTGIRWYELYNDGTGFAVRQQSTFAPDASWRWMGSMAINKDGAIALGYSKSSGSQYPSLNITSGAVGTSNSMQAEQVLQQGGGSQTGYSRWGDYSSMRVDPSDDTTFWYTGEYYKTSASYTWSTYIGSFSFVPDFSLSASPALVTFAEGATNSKQATVSVNFVNGYSGTVTLSSCPAADNFTWSALTPSQLTASGTATMTVGTLAASAGPAQYCQVTGTDTHNVVRSVTINAQRLPDFSVSTLSTGLAVKRGSSGQIVVNVPWVATTSSVSMSVSGLPSGVSASFSAQKVTTSASSSTILTLKARSSASRKTSYITITGNNGNFGHSITNFPLTVN